jgi:hypothetical protein
MERRQGCFEDSLSLKDFHLQEMSSKVIEQRATDREPWWGPCFFVASVTFCQIGPVIIKHSVGCITRARRGLVYVEEEGMM